MSQPLGNNEFAILQSHADAGNRIADYRQLVTSGHRYGELALGVDNNKAI